MVVAKGDWDYSGEPKLRILSLGAGAIFHNGAHG